MYLLVFEVKLKKFWCRQWDIGAVFFIHLQAHTDDRCRQICLTKSVSQCQTTKFLLFKNVFLLLYCVDIHIPPPLFRKRKSGNIDIFLLNFLKILSCSPLLLIETPQCKFIRSQAVIMLPPIQWMIQCPLCCT